MNHFAAVCEGGRSKVKHSKPVHTLETGDSANEHSLFIGQLFVGDIQNTGWRAELRVCDLPVTCKLDSGAQANVLIVSTYRRMKPMQQLEPSKTVLTALGNVRIKGALYRIQILCRRYTFWSYPAELTIADPPR